MKPHLKLLQERERAAWLNANAALFAVLGELIDSQWDRAELEISHSLQVETLVKQHDELFSELQRFRAEKEEAQQLILQYFPEGT